jgi:hypothetical protein
MRRPTLSALPLVLSVGALAFLGAPASAFAQEAGASLELAGVPATLALPGSFTITVSGSTGAASNAALDIIYGPAPCAASAEAQLEANPEEFLASPAAYELPALGFAGPFSVQAPGVGQQLSSPGVYTVCVFMEVSEEPEAVEPSEEEGERLVAVASATFTVLSPPTGTSPAAVTTRGAPSRCVVPHVKGMRLRVAERAIRRAHCAVGRVRRASSRHVRKGQVIWQSRRAGRPLPQGAKVGLLVSEG